MHRRKTARGQEARPVAKDDLYGNNVRYFWHARDIFRKKRATKKAERSDLRFAKLPFGIRYLRAVQFSHQRAYALIPNLYVASI